MKLRIVTEADQLDERPVVPVIGCMHKSVLPVLGILPERPVVVALLVVNDAPTAVPRRLRRGALGPLNGKPADEINRNCTPPLNECFPLIHDRLSPY